MATKAERSARDRARWDAFLREYKVDRNATRSAVCAGYAPSAARRAGYRLTTTNDYVKTEIEKWEREQREKSATVDDVLARRGINAAWVVLRAVELLDDPETLNRDKIRILEMLGKRFGAFEAPVQAAQEIRVVFGEAEDWSA